MKKLFLSVFAALGLAGCVATVDAPPAAVAYQSGCTNYCDDYGCREVCGTYYRNNGAVVYWDPGLGIWVGPHGYWHGGRWYRGYHPAYRGGYRGGFRGHRR